MAILPPDVKAVLQRQAPKLLRKPFEKKLSQEFKKIKKEMIAEFLNHSVTQEIMGGPSSSNISGTLDGVTNLFAFIGFDRGDSPIAPILSLLEATNIQYESEIQRGPTGIGNRFRVTLPTAEEIFQVTPLPWALGRSWAQGIERGISGLGYLLRKNKGRSGAAIQSRVKIRGGGFSNTPYISALIKKYTQRFQQLK